MNQSSLFISFQHQYHAFLGIPKAQPPIERSAGGCSVKADLGNAPPPRFFDQHFHHATGYSLPAVIRRGVDIHQVGTLSGRGREGWHEFHIALRSATDGFVLNHGGIAFFSSDG